MVNVKLDGVRFDHVITDRTSILDSNFGAVSFKKATLRQLVIIDSDLTKVSFPAAKLEGAIFSGSTFGAHWSNRRETNIRNGAFWGPDLSEADLSKSLSEDEIKSLLLRSFCRSFAHLPNCEIECLH